jgi:hypothetical protein
MHNQTTDRLQKIRDDVNEGKMRLVNAAESFRDPDPYVSNQLRRAGDALNDMDLYFRMLDEKRTPPRSAAEEARILDHAQFMLQYIALPQVKAIEDLLSKFGPDLTTVG